VTDRFAAQHGRDQAAGDRDPGDGPTWQAARLPASSDLDLILLYDFDSEDPDSDGVKSLHGAHYFARFTQRLISAFTTRPITACSTMSTCGCGRRDGQGRWPRASIRSPEYQDREAWTGSTWR